jgi:predicted DNA-binding transcriptional regulator YafY
MDGFGKATCGTLRRPMGVRGAETLVRTLKLVSALAGSKRGLRIAEMRESIGASRSTVYRYLDHLREAGLPLCTTIEQGEARTTLWGPTLPPFGPTAAQIGALRLARRALVGLEGSRSVLHLDQLVASYAGALADESTQVTASRAAKPDLVAKLERALHSGVRTRVRYRSANDDAARWRIVDPLGLRFVKGHLYFVAYDAGRARAVTYKLDRMSAVETLRDKAKIHTDIDLDALFARSVKTWSGQDTEVAVRISREAARFVHEYPLVAGQTVVGEADGAVVVRAHVSGIIEPMRWVLSWGRDAEALAPAALRTAVAAEVGGAAARYEDLATKKAPIASTGRPTQVKQARDTTLAVNDDASRARYLTRNGAPSGTSRRSG